MATNFFFNNFQNSQEQLLIEDLIIESIKIYGLDVFYIQRDVVSYDQLLGEDPNRTYTNAILVEMYVKNVDGFGGEGDFLSKFNIQIRDQITFTMAQRTFDREVEQYRGMTRPREGDLIYFPLNKKVFEIKFVEHEAIFYQLGGLQTYDLKCELFEYSNEQFKTGIAEVDAMERTYVQKQSLVVSNVNGTFVIGETVVQTVPQTSVSLSAEIFDITVSGGNLILLVGRFNSSVPDSEYTSFVSNTTVTGATSSTTATVVSDTENQTDMGDNEFFETEGDSIIDFTTADPFSEGGTF